jgi:hypothetical protein
MIKAGERVRAGIVLSQREVRMKGLIHNMALLIGGALVAAGCDSLPKTGGAIAPAAAPIGAAAAPVAPNGAAVAPAGCNGGACGDVNGGGYGHGGHGGLCPTAYDLTGRNNKELYDRCWPERYTALARREVNLAFTPQVQNGHVLDQTVWNHYFEPGTDRLNPLGQSQLQYISRRRPVPDTTVYLATANDLPYDQACPERYAGARQELDTLRVASVQKYLTAVNAGRPTCYQVLVHDPGDVTIHAAAGATVVPLMYGRIRGGLATAPGAAAGPSR